MSQATRDSSAFTVLTKLTGPAMRWISPHTAPSTNLVAFTMAIGTVIGSLFTSLYHWKRHEALQRKLRQEQTKLDYLQEKLQSLRTNDKKEPKAIRIFMDGAFDLLHFGHMNAFRLARSLGTHLIVGVNSDESITQCKGEPLMSDQERLTMVSCCKFVDEVVPDCPYIMNEEYLSWAIDKYQIDYVIHGDDPCIVDGKDVYAAAKAAGKFRTIPRTCGVSTTDIVGRMLLLTKDHHHHSDKDSLSGGLSIVEPCTETSSGGVTTDTMTTTLGRSSALQQFGLGHQSKFLTTSRMLQLFSADVKAPMKDTRVVYIDGDWDLFHPGHVAALKVARERGDYLIVGILGDAVVNRIRGANLPLMNLHERVLSVLGCRYVNDVLIDAPYHVTAEMVTSLKITEVVSVRPNNTFDDITSEDTRYSDAKAAGIYTIIEVETDFRISNVIQRIQRNQVAFQAKFERKMKAEQEYIDTIANAQPL